jgi:hypothetical protein
LRGINELCGQLWIALVRSQGTIKNRGGNKTRAATTLRDFSTLVQLKREFCSVRDRRECRCWWQKQLRAQHGRPPWHNVCLMSIRLGVTRFQAGSIRGLKAAVSAEDAVMNMDNNGGTRARTFTEMA